MTDTNRYPANVFWSEEDEGFIAVAADLPGCSAFGETQHEALTELQSAIVAWIEAARAAGRSDFLILFSLPQKTSIAARPSTYAKISPRAASAGSED